MITTETMIVEDPEHKEKQHLPPGAGGSEMY
jgi:hypothetical protein